MGALGNAGGVYLLTLAGLALLGWAFLALCDRARALDQRERAKKDPASVGTLTGRKDDVRVGKTSNVKIIAHFDEKRKGAA